MASRSPYQSFHPGRMRQHYVLFAFHEAELVRAFELLALEGWNEKPKAASFLIDLGVLQNAHADLALVFDYHRLRLIG